MSIRIKVTINTIYQMIGKGITVVSTIIGTVLITRFLGPQIFGEFSIAMTYVMLFYVFAVLGINAIVIREFAKKESLIKKNFSKVLTLRAVLGLGLMGAAFVLHFLFPYSRGVKTAIVAGLPLIFFNSVTKSAEIIFQARLKYKLQAISTAVGSLLSVALLFWIIEKESVSLYSIVSVYVLGSFATLLVSLYFVRHYITLRTDSWIDFKYWKRMLIDALPLGFALILNALMIQSDRLVLSVLSVPYSVGIYSLAYRVFDVALVIPTFFMNALYPILINLKENRKDKYRRTVYKAVLLMAILAVALTVLAVSLSGYIIPLIWGKEMADAVLPFNILMIGTIAFFVSSPLNWVLIVEKKQNIFPKIYGLAFLFNLVLNILFISKFDYLASSVITVATELIVVSYLLIYVVKVMRVENSP